MKQPKFLFLSAVILLLFASSACRLTNFISRDSEDVSQTVEAQVNATLTAIEAEKALQTPTVTPPMPTTTPISQAMITGQLTYPSEFIPPLRVVAFDLEDSDNYFMVEVQTGGTYTLEVMPGTYYVLAYLIDPAEIGATPGIAGAYSQAVLCGLHTSCDDHSLVPVEVSSGERVTGIDPADWYLPVGQSAGWPADPTRASTGTISGELGYPSEYIPPLRVVAFDVYSQNYYYVDTQRNQTEYQIIELPPSTYNVVAYVREEGPDFSGAYTHFVTCGMTTACTNHQLIDVNVYAGEVIDGVNPVDFYAQPGEVDWPDNPTD